MGGFEDPEGVTGVCDGGVVPFDLEMSGRFFEEWGPREGVDVEFGFGRHVGEGL